MTGQPDDLAALRQWVDSFPDDGSSMERPDDEDVAMLERWAEVDRRGAALGPMSPEDEDAVFESMRDVPVDDNVVPLHPEQEPRVVRRPIRRPEARD